MTDGYAELEFDLPGALLSEIVGLLDRMNAGELNDSNLAGVSEEPGVYVLISKGSGEPLYIGKTDHKKGLRNRLKRHARKLEGRRNIRPELVCFKAIRVFVFTAINLETSLMKHLGGPGKLPWNNSGFGSNDTGKQRDTTKYKTSSFDRQYPIDLDSVFVPMHFENHPVQVSEVMQALKTNLPYLLRFERPNPQFPTSFHDDFVCNSVPLTAVELTTRQVLEQCLRVLPTGWLATELPSHIICYKNDKRSFPSGEKIAES